MRSILVISATLSVLGLLLSCDASHRGEPRSAEEASKEGRFELKMNEADLDGDGGKDLHVSFVKKSGKSVFYESYNRLSGSKGLGFYENGQIKIIYVFGLGNADHNRIIVFDAGENPIDAYKAVDDGVLERIPLDEIADVWPVDEE